MYEEIIVGLIAVDFATTMAGTAVLTKKIDYIDRRLAILETEHLILTSRVRKEYAQ